MVTHLSLEFILQVHISFDQAGQSPEGPLGQAGLPAPLQLVEQQLHGALLVQGSLVGGSVCCCNAHQPSLVTHMCTVKPPNRAANNVLVLARG